MTKLAINEIFYIYPSLCMSKSQSTVNQQIRLRNNITFETSATEQVF